MPHVNIKYFPRQLSDEQKSQLVEELTATVMKAFEVEERMVSIALEPVAAELWTERVHTPELVERKDLLCKVPNY